MSEVSKRTLLLGGAAVVAVAAVGAGAVLMNSGPAVASVETGAQAPAFSVQDADGNTRTLAEFRRPMGDPRMDQLRLPACAQAL
ncbi:MAG: hypothetical protein R3C16_04645 [Hyphomonadaceae bacterium]